MSTQGFNKTQSIMAGLAIFLLSGLSLYLWKERSQLRQALDRQTTELNQVNEFYDELEMEFEAANKELNSMKTENTQLNELIESQKAELRQQRNRIARLARENKDLSKARIALDELRTRVNGYLAQIEKLKAENQALANTNMALREEKNILTREIQDERLKSEEILEAKALLMSKNETLSQERDMLSKKVSAASVIQISDIQAQGYKIRKSGKLANKRKAKKVDMIQVCFKAGSNLVAQAGKESFFVRIVNPIGETLFLKDKGSGVLSTNEDEQLRFTNAVDVDYQNKELPVCIQWHPELPFMKGSYKIEIFNKGYKVGQSNLELD